MENQKLPNTPNEVLVRMQIVRLGKILFGLQFIMISVMYASLLTIIAYPLYYVTLVSITMLTVFLIFVWYPNFTSWWKPTGLNNLFLILAESWKYTVPIALVLSVLAIVCLSFDKNEKHTKRIAACVVICVLAIIFLILRAAVRANG